MNSALPFEYNRSQAEYNHTAKPQYLAENHLWGASIDPALSRQAAENTIIAIIDTGVDFRSPYLQAARYTEPDGYELPDITDHGTKVAGILVGQGEEYRGLLPDERIISVQLEKTATDEVSIHSLIQAVETAVRYHPDIINISAGTRKDDPELHALIKTVKEQGIIIVAAAGNTGSEVCDYPAAYDEVIAVGSVDRRKRISSFSSTSEKIAIYAPGEKIATVAEESIVSFSGTSAATPFVTALVALLIAADPSLDFEAIQEILIDSADQVQQGNSQTVKVINYNRAIETIMRRRAA
jgi:subtilisin family serine protease